MEARVLAFCRALSQGFFEQHKGSTLCATTLEGGTFHAEILVDLYLHENHLLADGSKVSEEKVPFLTCTKVLWRFATLFFFFKGSDAKIALCKL